MSKIFEALKLVADKNGDGRIDMKDVEIVQSLLQSDAAKANEKLTPAGAIFLSFVIGVSGGVLGHMGFVWALNVWAKLWA